MKNIKITDNKLGVDEVMITDLVKVLEKLSVTRSILLNPEKYEKIKKEHGTSGLGKSLENAEFMIRKLIAEKIAPQNICSNCGFSKDLHRKPVFFNNEIFSFIEYESGKCQECGSQSNGWTIDWKQALKDFNE